MHNLPDELLHLIFESVHSKSTYVASDLSPSALVNHRWSSIARRFLFTHITISSPPTHALDTVASFIDFIATSSHLARYVRSLKLTIEPQRGWDPLHTDNSDGKFKTTLDTYTLGNILAGLPSLSKLSLHYFSLAASPTRYNDALYTLDEFAAAGVCCRGKVEYGALLDILSLFSSVEKLKLCHVFPSLIRGSAPITHPGPPKHFVAKSLLLEGAYTPAIYAALRSQGFASMLTDLKLVLFAGRLPEETIKSLGMLAPNLRSLTLGISHLFRGVNGRFTFIDAVIAAFCVGLPTCHSLHTLNITSCHLSPRFLPRTLLETPRLRDEHALSTLLSHIPPSVRHLALDVGPAKTFPFTLLRLPQLAYVRTVAFPTWTEEADKELVLEETGQDGWHADLAGRFNFVLGEAETALCEQCVL